MSRWQQDNNELAVLERFKNAIVSALDERLALDDQVFATEDDYGEPLERRFTAVHGSPYGGLSNIRTVLLAANSRASMALALDHLIESAAGLRPPSGSRISPLEDVLDAIWESFDHHPELRLCLVQVGQTFEIHASGAPNLDAEVVAPTLVWLARYPGVQREAGRSLRKLAEGESAESLNAARLALEMLLRTVLGNRKTLENQIGRDDNRDAPLPKWLHGRGAKGQTITLARNVISSFTAFQNAWVKHPPPEGASFVSAEPEFGAYIMFILIRLIASLAQPLDQ
jgi:hypothetical protein